MASLIYASCFEDTFRGAIDFDTDPVNVMLLSGDYTPDKAAHTKRSDLSGEVSGTGYVPGGALVSVQVMKDAPNGRIDISLGGASWATSTITARYAAYYKARGGAAEEDELVALIDFGGNVSSTNGTFTLTASTLRIQF